MLYSSSPFFYTEGEGVFRSAMLGLLNYVVKWYCILYKENILPLVQEIHFNPQDTFSICRNFFFFNFFFFFFTMGDIYFPRT